MLNVRIPQSIVNHLKKKYNDSRVEDILLDFIDLVFTYAVENLACTFDGFGKFIAYKTFSNRSKTIRPRFKFRPSPALIRRMVGDSYVMNKLTLAMTKKEFTEEHEKKCKRYRDLRKANARACDASVAIREDKDYEQEQLAMQFIEELLEEGSDSEQ